MDEKILEFIKEGDVPQGCKDLVDIFGDVNIFINSLGSPLKNGQYNLPGYPNIDFYIRHIELDIK